jgi:rhamnosyltransferase
VRPVQCERTIAGIVTFNPDIDQLLENLRAVAPQVSSVLVFDNGSSNVSHVRDAVRDVENAELLECAHNVGIAAALNRISVVARERGGVWLVTLDQDSACAPDMVATLREYADELTPIVTPYIVDRNKITLDEYSRLELPPLQYHRRAASKGAITSGALLNLRTLDDVGGFDEVFFIDYVDYDLNMRFMRAGYRVARVNGTYLLHQVGNARKTWLRTPRKSLDGYWYWETFYSFGHSPTRCYYKARNRVLYSRKHWRFIGFGNEGIAQIPQQILLTLLFENERLSKLRAFIRGIRDGFRVALPAGSADNGVISHRSRAGYDRDH